MTVYLDRNGVPHRKLGRGWIVFHRMHVSVYEPVAGGDMVIVDDREGHFVAAADDAPGDRGAEAK